MGKFIDELTHCRVATEDQPEECAAINGEVDQVGLGHARMESDPELRFEQVASILRDLDIDAG